MHAYGSGNEASDQQETPSWATHFFDALLIICVFLLFAAFAGVIAYTNQRSGI
jgi:hypothetical protein